MVCIQTPSKYDSLPGAIWLRCERFPIRTSLFKILSSNSAIADDKVTLSFNFARLCKLNADSNIMQSKLDNAKFYHLVDLLSVLHLESPYYILKSQNCWFFVATIIGALQYLQQTWVVAPKTTRVKKALQGLDSAGKRVSNVVQQRFIEHWTEANSMTGHTPRLDQAWLTPSLRPAARLIRVGHGCKIEENITDCRCFRLAVLMK